MGIGRRAAAMSSRCIFGRSTTTESEPNGDPTDPDEWHLDRFGADLTHAGQVRAVRVRPLGGVVNVKEVARHMMLLPGPSGSTGAAVAGFSSLPSQGYLLEVRVAP